MFVTYFALGLLFSHCAVKFKPSVLVQDISGNPLNLYLGVYFGTIVAPDEYKVLIQFS